MLNWADRSAVDFRNRGA